MAQLRGTEINVPFNHELKCPVCLVPLDITVRTQITDASASVGGTEGLGYPTSIPIRVSTKPVELVIEEHKCPITLKD